MDKVRFDIPKYEKVYDVEIDVAGKLVNVCSRLSEEEKRTYSTKACICTVDYG